MAYELIETEGYRGYPTSRIKMNHSLITTHQTIDDVVAKIAESSKDIKARLTLIAEWSEKENNRVVKRELYQARNGHGRITRKYEICKAEIQKRVFDDSLI